MLLAEMNGPTHPNPRHYASIIGALGQRLGSDRFPDDQRASLKRHGFAYRTFGGAIALRVLVEAGAPVETMKTVRMENWVWLVHCMAIVSGAGRDPHSVGGSARPGFVLRQIGYGEAKVGHLLNARREAFCTLLERTARRIAQARIPINWSRLAPLILAEDPEDLWAESARIAISRDYQLASNTEGTSQTVAPFETSL